MSDKKKILIIDDEADYNEVLKDRLEYEGFDVTAVLDAKSGLESMRKASFDIIILDIMMPEVDGFEVMRMIEREDHILSKSPIVFVTAYGRNLTDDERTLVGDRPFIRKPFDIDELLKVIRDSTM